MKEQGDIIKMMYESYNNLDLVVNQINKRKLWVLEQIKRIKQTSNNNVDIIVYESSLSTFDYVLDIIDIIKCNSKTLEELK